LGIGNALAEPVTPGDTRFAGAACDRRLGRGCLSRAWDEELATASLRRGERGGSPRFRRARRGTVPGESKKSPQRACKPGSVIGPSPFPSPVVGRDKGRGGPMVIPLGRRLPAVSSSLPGSRNEPDRLMLPVWPCTGWGLPSQASHPACWCALTAPFHPYPPRRAVYFLLHFP